MRTDPQPPGGWPDDSANEFEVDVHVMDTAAQYVEHVGSVMTGEVNHLMNQLSGLVGSNWQSPAAQAFQTAQDAWSGAQNRMNAALLEMASGLKDTSTKYDQADWDSKLGITKAVETLLGGDPT